MSPGEQPKQDTPLSLVEDLKCQQLRMHELLDQLIKKISPVMVIAEQKNDGLVSPFKEQPTLLNSGIQNCIERQVGFNDSISKLINVIIL